MHLYLDWSGGQNTGGAAGRLPLAERRDGRLSLVETKSDDADALKLNITDMFSFLFTGSQSTLQYEFVKLYIPK